MSKVEELKDIVCKGEKSKFIDIFYDFSTEDILGLTEQDFKDLIEYCGKIEFDGIYEFFDFLSEEGLQAIKDSTIRNVKEKSLLSRFYFSVILVIYSKRDKYFADITMHLGLSYQKLAQSGVDPKKNLKKSIKLQKESRKIFKKYGLDYGGATINMGIAYGELAELGVDPTNNLESAIKLQQEAREIFPKGSLDYAGTNMNLGLSYKNLAELGIDPVTNIKKSINSQEEAREIFPKKSMNYGHATVNLGLAHEKLAELGIEPIKNIKKSIKFQKEAREIFPKDYFDYSGASLNQGYAHMMLSELGVDPTNNLKISIKLQEEARKLSLKKSPEYTRATVNLGLAHEKLAELGIEPINNLKISIQLLNEAKKIFLKKSPDYSRAIMNLGIAHKSLAELKIEPIDNLKMSIKLHQEAREIFIKNSPEYAAATINLGNAHALLADLGVMPEKNLEQCIKLYKETREIFQTGSFDYAGNIMNLGVAYLRLADLATDAITNLDESIKLLQKAREIFPKNSGAYARTTMNLGTVHSRLMELGEDMEKNFKIAEELYEISKVIFQEIKDGWGYSSAVLNHYVLYRKFFWKNGDKNLLGILTNILKESKKNIENWDVLRKNDIIGELYSIEADLCEFNDDYYNAGMKYRDAYSLTKNLYYKFMCEFSRAKLSKDEKPFCKLAHKWKTANKPDIFLDIYDYTIFECHLEEAIENEALRFDEIKAAKNKLKEVHSRTQIHHVKVRVSACIEILNSYLNYFPEKDEEKDEEKAKENMSTACRIFKGHGYKHEINLCNLFVKAIKNKDNQEVWLNLIKIQLSNNLSKLIGEAAINEIAKSQRIGVKADLGEIKTSIKEINKILDNLTISLKSGISEELVISVGVEFAGTGAKHEIHIPLQEITYPNINKDFEVIKSGTIIKLTSLPVKLATKIRDYLIRNKKYEVLKYLN